jgi:hypothetical protein
LEDGQKMGPALNYAPLPPALVAKIKSAVATIENPSVKPGAQVSQGD